jgi:hypothetical protein
MVASVFAVARFIGIPRAFTSSLTFASNVSWLSSSGLSGKESASRHVSVEQRNAEER